ncbi:MAG: hypothetical protein M1835_001999 [Candelina submexicana]|nr:MAG: hypothetical protein M1835_001999 [Candelina submexicana]
MTLKQVIASQIIQGLVRSLVFGTTGSSEPSMSICPHCQSNWRRPEKVRHTESTPGEGEANYALLYEGDEEVEGNSEDNVVKMVDAAKDGSDLERASLNRAQG